MKKILIFMAMLSAFFTATAAHAAALVYVGNWRVDQGPTWYGSPPNGPLAYTGKEAAALLFGGSASDYVISTLGSDPNTANYKAWYSVIGYFGNQGNGGSIFADDYSSKSNGLYYGPTYAYTYNDPAAAASAYVNDNAVGSTFTNYAFLITSAAPEPGTWIMMIVGFGIVGASMRRRRGMDATNPIAA